MIWNRPQLADCSAAARSSRQAASSRSHSPASEPEYFLRSQRGSLSPGCDPSKRPPVSRWKALPSNSTLSLPDGGLREPLPLDSTQDTARSGASWTYSVVASSFEQQVEHP